MAIGDPAVRDELEATRELHASADFGYILSYVFKIRVSNTNKATLQVSSGPDQRSDGQ